MEVPEKLVPYFKVSKELKKVVEDADPTIEEEPSGDGIPADRPEGLPGPGISRSKP